MSAPVMRDPEYPISLTCGCRFALDGRWDPCPAAARMDLAGRLHVDQVVRDLAQAVLGLRRDLVRQVEIKTRYAGPTRPLGAP